MSAPRWFLKSRYLPAAAALLAVLLALPSLRSGWMLDDWLHRAVLLEKSLFRELLGSPSEMFRFFHGDPERTGRLMDIGIYPWWTYPPLKAEFLQALTVLTHRLDYALWPDSPALMHAHSLLWLGAAAGLTAVFYRRMFGATWVAGVAALLFAVDDARGATVGFIANRNVLVAATFGVSALIAHDLWRRDGSRPGGDRMHSLGLRPRLQEHARLRLDRNPLGDARAEADEMDQDAGGKSDPAPRPGRPAAAARQ